MSDNVLILYTSEDGESQFILRELGGQVWLTQLEMIIAVGYRVRSTRGTQFRQWATRTLG